MPNYLRHLILHELALKVAKLCGKSTVLGVCNFGMRAIVFDRCKDFVTDDLVESWRRRRKCFHICTVKRTDACVVEHFAVMFIENYVHRIRSPNIRELFLR